MNHYHGETLIGEWASDGDKYTCPVTMWLDPALMFGGQRLGSAREAEIMQRAAELRLEAMKRAILGRVGMKEAGR